MQKSKTVNEAKWKKLYKPLFIIVFYRSFSEKKLLQTGKGLPSWPRCNEYERRSQNKFNIIHTAYSILSDASKKELYDNGSNVFFTKATVAARWEHYLKPVDNSTIDKARKKYQGSTEEKNDIAREFIAGNGSMTYLLNNIPFMRSEDENRIIEIIKELIDEGEVKKIGIRKLKK